MTVWSDLDGEMTRLPLDADTADRLLAGSVRREDAPPGYGEVASLLASLVPPCEEHVFSWSEAAIRRASQHSPLSRRSALHRFKLAGAAAAVALTCTTGLAFAGALPGAAQNMASSMLAKVGITVQGPDDAAGAHPQIRGTSSPDDAVGVRNDSKNTEAQSGGKGDEISDLATTTDLTGVDKGTAISTAASEGKSQAGQHGQATEDHGSPSTGSDSGAATADQASGGRSTAGAGNGAAGQSHQP